MRIKKCIISALGTVASDKKVCASGKVDRKNLTVQHWTQGILLMVSDVYRYIVLSII